MGGVQKCIPEATTLLMWTPNLHGYQLIPSFLNLLLLTWLKMFYDQQRGHCACSLCWQQLLLQEKKSARAGWS